MKRILSAVLTAVLLLCVGCASSDAQKLDGFAMDTQISVTVYGDRQTAQKVMEAVAEIENEISWSIDGSAVSRLNETGSVESAVVAEAVKTADRLFDDTDGQYSLVTRELCSLWNVTGDAPSLPSEKDIAAALLQCGQRILVSGDRVTSAGKVDFGSVGKGIACDEGAKIINSSGKSGIMVMGSSIALCGTKPDKSLWSVAVAHPDDRNRRLGTLYLEGGKFISTSGDSQRYFEYDGVRYHHIISAVSGYPSDSGLRSVTVVCDSGIMSDALSTACFLIGYEPSLDLLRKYGAEAVFVNSDLTVRVTDRLKDHFEVAG